MDNRRYTAKDDVPYRDQREVVIKVKQVVQGEAARAAYPNTFARLGD